MRIDNRTIYDENWAHWVDMKVYGPASRWLRHLIHQQLLRLPEGSAIESVLDVGCGEGTITKCLSDWLREATVTGIDFSLSGIECAQSRYSAKNLKFIHDLDSELLQETYDMVTAFEVLEHVEDWRDLLERICRASSKYVMLSFPTGRMRRFEVHVGHYRNFGKGEVEEFMAGQSFLPARIYYAGFPFYSPLYREFCNLAHLVSNSVTTGTYGVWQKGISHILYSTFRFASSQRRFGDQFCGLFVRNG